MDLINMVWIPATVVGFIVGYLGGKKGLIAFIVCWLLLCGIAIAFT